MFGHDVDDSPPNSPPNDDDEPYRLPTKPPPKRRLVFSEDQQASEVAAPYVSTEMRANVEREMWKELGEKDLRSFMEYCFQKWYYRVDEGVIPWDDYSRAKICLLQMPQVHRK